MNDMDELEILQQRVQQLEKELMESRQLRSCDLDQLRAPLVPLKGFVRTLLNDENEEWYTREDRREFYTILDENVDRLYRGIQNLPGSADVEKPRFVMNWQADADVRQIAERVVALHQQQTNKHIVVLDFEPPQILVEADPSQLEVVLDNLIGSAIKYSPDGGEVRVCARLEAPTKEWPFETLLVQVKDQGLGLSKQEMSHFGAKLGDRRGKPKALPPKRPATGVFAVRLAIEAHQGALWFESEGKGKGTTFNVRIPVNQPEGED